MDWDWFKNNAAVIALILSSTSLMLSFIALGFNWRNTSINSKKFKGEEQGKLKADFSIKRENGTLIIKNNGSEAIIGEIYINDELASKSVFVTGGIPNTIAKGSEFTLKLNLNQSFSSPFQVKIKYSDRYFREINKFNDETPIYETTV